jgi:hypothetical protein
VTRRLKAGIAEPEWTFIARKRFGKQVPVEMNTHATREELSFLSNGEVKTLCNNRVIVRKRYFLLGLPEAI